MDYHDFTVDFSKVSGVVDLHIMAVDCCEHILEILGSVPASRLTAVASKDRAQSNSASHDVDLIVIGVARYPVRRLFISQLRRVYPEVPVMILRRLENGRESQDAIRSEFILG